MRWEAPSASHTDNFCHIVTIFVTFGVSNREWFSFSGLRAFRLWTFYAKCSATWAFGLLASALAAVTH
jgi:hypothetical protein